MMRARLESLRSARVVLAAGVLLIAVSATSAGEMTVVSPDGRVKFLVNQVEAGLEFQVRFKDRPVVDRSRMCLVLDEVNLTRGAMLGKIESYEVNEKYPCRGGHAEATNRCRGARIPVTHSGSKTAYTFEVRAYDDGVAFRFIVPGDDKPRVPDESTTYVVPAGSTVWYHDLGGHYEAVHTQKAVADVPAGQWVAPPMTFRLPDGLGYAAITEAALANYSGMALQADGHRGFTLALGDKHPPSYPFRLRYATDVDRLSKPAAVTGTITTPWRVIMVGADLNALVNSDLVANLSPPPDTKLFPDGPHVDWVKPGRAVWKYLDGGQSTLDGVKEFSRLAGELGFEYQVVEGFWSRWTDEQIREVVTYSREQAVGLWFWRHSKQLRTPGDREAFFKKLHDLGVVGAKIDFFDHEHKEVIDLYQELLKDAARHRIMVNFHGANKPTGEARTWPNELIREGVRGMEASKLQARARHNATLPFTRYLAGPADYTPVLFGPRRGDTTWAHQSATAVVFTEPLLTYGAHPKTLLANSAVEMIKSIPSVWDETIALSGCEIGELAAFARRRGDTWFLAVLNGPTARTISVPLSFLSAAKYQGLEVRDQSGTSDAVRVGKTVASKDGSVTIEMESGGGYVARYTKAE
jgi:alpha-glucosidase